MQKVIASPQGKLLTQVRKVSSVLTQPSVKSSLQKQQYVTSRFSIQRQGSSRLARTTQRIRCASDVEVSKSKGKLLNKMEISSMIPREDLMDQLQKWATIEVGNEGYKLFGMHCELDDLIDSDGNLQGFIVWMQRKGERVSGVLVCFDEESQDKFEWIGRGEDGMPQTGGSNAPIAGKHLEVWKVDSNPVDDEIRSGVKLYCQMLVNALNRYYAFGSVFVEEG